jgi:hypothetical protein
MTKNQLGFGCGFPNTKMKRDVMNALACAYDAGIRHFCALLEMLSFLQSARASVHSGSVAKRTGCRACVETGRHSAMLQFNWTAFSRDLDLNNSQRLHYWVFPHSTKLREVFRDQPALCRLWSDRVDLDLADPEKLAAIMLKASLVKHPEAVTLFTATPKNIRNMAIA